MSEKIAILIPVYNGLLHLQKSLPVLANQTSKINTYKYEIIVIDDNSNDGTKTWIQNTYPEVKVLNGSGDLWWSGGMNKGIEYVFGDKSFKYVLLWNHDTICKDDYFNILTKKIDIYDDQTIIGSKIYFLDRTNVIFNMGAVFNSVTGKSKLIGYNSEDAEEYSQPMEVDWTGGMGTLIPVKTFQSVGVFDRENFPQYHGDSDFFLRSTKHGYKLIIQPDLKIWNDKTNSGMEHNAKWSSYYRSLFSLKSNHNLKVKFIFLKRHSTSLLAYFFFIYEFFIYSGSFLKHWMINIFCGHGKN